MDDLSTLDRLGIEYARALRAERAAMRRIIDAPDGNAPGLEAAIEAQQTAAYALRDARLALHTEAARLTESDDD